MKPTILLLALLSVLVPAFGQTDEIDLEAEELWSLMAEGCPIWVNYTPFYQELEGLAPRFDVALAHPLNPATEALGITEEKILRRAAVLLREEGIEFVPAALPAIQLRVYVQDDFYVLAVLVSTEVYRRDKLGNLVSTGATLFERTVAGKHGNDGEYLYRAIDRMYYRFLEAYWSQNERIYTN